MKPWQCQLALAVTQTAFCVGSVYLKSSLRQVDSSDGHVFHPIIYAFLREATAGPIMCAMAWFSSGAGSVAEVACVSGCPFQRSKSHGLLRPCGPRPCDLGIPQESHHSGPGCTPWPNLP